MTFNHKLDEQASPFKQIANAEKQKKMRYIISVPRDFYEIEYGLMKRSGVEKRCKVLTALAAPSGIFFSVKYHWIKEFRII